MPVSMVSPHGVPDVCQARFRMVSYTVWEELLDGNVFLLQQGWRRRKEFRTRSRSTR